MSVITQETIDQALSYADFMELTSKIFEQEKKDKPYDSKNYFNYTKSNFRWSKRMSRAFVLTEGQEKILQSIKKPILWILLNEPWCGDGAFTQALLNQIAQRSKGKITLKILLRDSHLSVMEKYLTNGGMAIPKLVILDTNLDEISTWGPRPKKLQNMLDKWKQDPEFTNEMKIQRVYQWYIKDKNQSAQEEIFDMLESLEN